MSKRNRLHKKPKGVVYMTSIAGDLDGGDFKKLFNNNPNGYKLISHPWDMKCDPRIFKRKERG